MAYRKSGQGRAVVILASPLVLSSAYSPLVEKLEASYEVFVVELPGSGRSSGLKEPWTFSQYAEWLPDLFLSLSIQPDILIGHSNSGAVALLLALRHPKAIRRVVLVDTIGCLSSHSLISVLLRRGVDAILEPRLTLRAWWHLIYNLVFHWQNFINQLKLVRFNLLDQPESLPPSSLLAWGKRDHTLPLSCLEKLKEAHPQAQVHVSTHGSHDWLIERSTEFAKVIAKFDQSLNKDS